MSKVSGYRFQGDFRVRPPWYSNNHQCLLREFYFCWFHIFDNNSFVDWKLCCFRTLSTTFLQLWFRSPSWRIQKFRLYSILLVGQLIYFWSSRNHLGIKNDEIEINHHTLRSLFHLQVIFRIRFWSILKVHYNQRLTIKNDQMTFLTSPIKWRHLICFLNKRVVTNTSGSNFDHQNTPKEFLKNFWTLSRWKRLRKFHSFDILCIQLLPPNNLDCLVVLADRYKTPALDWTNHPHRFLVHRFHLSKSLYFEWYQNGH